MSLFRSLKQPTIEKPFSVTFHVRRTYGSPAHVRNPGLDRAEASHQRWLLLLVVPLAVSTGTAKHDPPAGLSALARCPY